MDNFLKKLYDEAMEKQASAERESFYHNLEVSDLESFLGLNKMAVGGPVEPAVSPAMKKSIEARETKSKDTEKRVAQGQSKSETQPERNIAPLIPGQSIPERNFTQPGKSIPENTLAVKQASFEWADQMGRAMAKLAAHADPALAAWAQQPQIDAAAQEAIERNIRELGPAASAKPAAGSAAAKPAAGSAKGFLSRLSRGAKMGIGAGAGAATALTAGALLARHRMRKAKERSMGKAASVQQAIKLAHEIPESMMPALIETTAAQLVKAAATMKTAGVARYLKDLSKRYPHFGVDAPPAAKELFTKERLMAHNYGRGLASRGGPNASDWLRGMGESHKGNAMDIAAGRYPRR
jgi:hypothetical protein